MPEAANYVPRAGDTCICGRILIEVHRMGVYCPWEFYNGPHFGVKRVSASDLEKKPRA